jgi:hypothetical protein
MYTLRFPAYLGPKLASVFEQHSITDHVSKNGGEIVLTLGEQDYVSLRFVLRGSRFGPKGAGHCWSALLRKAAIQTVHKLNLHPISTFARKT